MSERIAEIEDAIRDLDEIVLELKKQLLASKDSREGGASAIGFKIYRQPVTNYGAWAGKSE